MCEYCNQIPCKRYEDEPGTPASVERAVDRARAALKDLVDSLRRACS